MKKAIYTPNGKWLLSTRTKTQRRKLISWASKFMVNCQRRRGFKPDLLKVILLGMYRKEIPLAITPMLGFWKW